MRPSEACYTLIKKWEGIRDGDPTTVNLDPYLCPANVVTIGWGHACYWQGKQLRGSEGLAFARKTIYPTGITVHQAESMLKEDVDRVAAEVTSLLKVPVSQQQFDALVSFAYNVGTDIDEDDLPEGLGDSTLLKHVNAGEFHKAADEFGKWVFAAGSRLNGLVRRRFDERQLFLAGTPELQEKTPLDPDEEV